MYTQDRHNIKSHPSINHPHVSNILLLTERLYWWPRRGWKLLAEMANSVMQGNFTVLRHNGYSTDHWVKRTYGRSGKLKEANFELTSHWAAQNQQENLIPFSITAHLHATSREMLESAARGDEHGWPYTKSPILSNRPCLWHLLTNTRLGLKRTFRWVFIIVDISKATLGAHFLKHYGLLVNTKSHCLLDPLKQLKV